MWQTEEPSSPCNQIGTAEWEQQIQVIPWFSSKESAILVSRYVSPWSVINHLTSKPGGCCYRVV